MSKTRTRIIILIVTVLSLYNLSCTRNEIDFGTISDNNYTKLLYIDTVGIQLSTIVIDSFTTSSTSSFLIGKYKDPYLGLVATTPFMQFSKPSSIPDIPITAVFDSLSFIAKLKHYYYGDTSVYHTVYVNELAEAIELGYNDRLYSTSNFSIKPTPLGSATLKVQPMADDSILIRLSDVKGNELFEKIRDKHIDVTSSEHFLEYFKGISITTGPNDTSLLYGLEDSIIIRVHYHNNIPDPKDYYIDLYSESNSYAFNQIHTDRTGTGLDVTSNNITGMTEVPASETGNMAFSQPATGLYLKMTFPSLRTILQSENLVQLLKAELIIRPVPHSFDDFKLKLPETLTLYKTDESNLNSGSVYASGGSSAIEATPVIDYIFGTDNYYSFEITSYISSLLNTGGTEDNGLFIVQGLAGASLQELNRLITTNTSSNNFKTELRLSVLVINK